MLVELAEGTTVAGVFTRSLTSAAPVDWCRSILKEHSARALLVHAGNANAFTGKRGRSLVNDAVKEVAAVIECRPELVYVAATGIIGEPVPEQKVLKNIRMVHEGLKVDNWELAATSIMTTDTYPKFASAIASINSEPVTISGFAKGAGMIAPDMGTMLCFIFTDACIRGEDLQGVLNRANLRTFSNISIDGDTSTNDTLLLFATGKAISSEAGASEDFDLGDFEEKLTGVLMDLALQVVKDGEGIEKFLSVTVKGARTESDAHCIARSIAEAPLVKSAMGGSSPNWGRIVMAVGKAGPFIDKNRLCVWLGSHQVAREGDPNDDVDLNALLEYMLGPEIDITVDVGVGSKSATMWTSDLTVAYVEINASYKT